MKKTIVTVMASVLITACGGGSGSTSDSSGSVPSIKPPVSPPDTDKAYLEGRAADGYLQNALVCLDLNSNAQCDSDEPVAITGQGGVFKLPLPDALVNEAHNYMLVVKAIAGQTIDEDTGLIIDAGYTLRSVVNTSGSQFISPISTLISSHVDKGLSFDAAVAEVTKDFKLNADLLADFIAGSDNGTNRDFLKVYRLAQVIANAQSKAEVESEANEDFSIKDLNAIYDVLTNASKKIADLIEQGLGNTDFEAGEVIEELNLEQLVNRPISDRYIVTDYTPFQKDKYTKGTMVERVYKSITNTGDFLIGTDTKYNYEQDFIKAYYDSRMDVWNLRTIEKHHLVYNSSSNRVAEFDYSVKGTYEVFDGKEFVEISHKDAPKGVVTARRYKNDGKNGSVFDKIGINTTFLVIPGDGITSHAKYTTDFLDVFFPGQFHESLLTLNNQVDGDWNNKYANLSESYFTARLENKDSIALIKEELQEPMYLTWFNSDLCTEGTVFTCNTVRYGYEGEYVYPATLEEVVSRTIESHLEMTLPVTYGGLSGFGATVFFDGRVLIIDETGYVKVEGTWEEKAQPFKHIQLNLPVGAKLVNGDTGLKGGKAILFERDGLVQAGEYFEAGLTAGELVGKDKFVGRTTQSPVRSTIRYLEYYLPWQMRVPHDFQVKKL